ncbi:GNAT family N-acetyltransferase, partial [Achromobacter sp. SIMBA_011]|uniref:GNAT family N-acetyltransferase n=1 Tax=Achromobacter sp. SIMBA_011 TaxID=3085759 RepID=UPI00397B9083
AGWTEPAWPAFSSSPKIFQTTAPMTPPRIGASQNSQSCCTAHHASIRLHENLGFTVAGRFSEVGTKFGRWLDLTCMELKLN